MKRYHLRKGCVRAQVYRHGMIVTLAPRTAGAALVAMAWCGRVVPTSRFKANGRMCSVCARVKLRRAQLAAAGAS